MPKIAAPAVLVLKDVQMSIEGDDYARHLDAVTLTPSSSTVTWQGLSPDAAFSDATATTWTCVLSGAQDWDSPDSLCRHLFEHEGQTVEATFAPRSGSGPSFEASLTLAAPTIGGTVGQVTSFSVTCGVSGRPQLIDPAPLP